jgi:NADH-quinone oxidoreductase subunit M
MLSDFWLLTVLLFLPLFWAIPLLVIPDRAEGVMRGYALLGSGLTLALCCMLWGRYTSLPPDALLANGGMPIVANAVWVPVWNIWYRLGVDGLSLPLVLLTGLVSFLAIAASASVTKHLRGFLALMLLLETGLLGVFLALDFFLFYVFWELVLLPMYFLIGVWGGPRREYAAIKFFLYTLAGSVLMLVAMLVLYFGAGNTFDMLELARIAQGQGTPSPFSPLVQTILFVLLFIAFAIKLPIFPFHTWLPDAHVEAPTPVSMVLAGVLLKMGGYAMLRVAFPMCPYAVQWGAMALATLGVFNILYGALVALGQTDFKRLVAYSSVSHMGYVLLGMAVWVPQALGASPQASEAWKMGLNASIFQMIAHGITSTGMFFLVGVLYDRVHHRQLNAFGGIMAVMPHYSALAAGLFFAALGLPGLCGFWGEVLAVMAAFRFSIPLGVVAATGLVVTAAYILWTIQRVYFGAEYKGPHGEGLVPMTPTEGLIAYVLMVLAIVLGVYPEVIFAITRPTMDVLAANLELGFQAAQQLLAAQR